MNDIIKAIIIDDEPLAHKVIQTYAEDIPFLKIVGQAYLATDAYALLNTQTIDLIFLDIHMPILKGLEFLRTLDRTPAIIVTSAHQEYALEGFELQVTDYLLKPFRFERFIKAVMLVKSTIQPTGQRTDSMFIKVEKKQLHLDLSSIQFLESYGNYVKVWVEDRFYLTPRTLSSFHEILDDRFLQIHKSFIVQLACIQYVEGNQIEMQNGRMLTIGKSYRSLVKGMF
ncbi:MAG: response regulator transcription factor [Bacteroidota bacterium]